MCVCVCVAKPVAVELRCHATALIIGGCSSAIVLNFWSFNYFEEYIII